MTDVLDQFLPQGLPPTPTVSIELDSEGRPPFPQFFDSSMLSSFKTCETLFYNQYIHHWKPKDQSVHLHAGGAFAKGMEVARKAFYVDRHDEETSVALGLQALLTFYGDFDCPEDSAKSATRMAGAFEFYFANYPLTWDDCVPLELSNGKRAIEFSFAEPCDVRHPVTGDPILIVGRLDAILGAFGARLITDEKTTSSLGPSWSRQWDLRGQFSGYAWGCQRAGIKVDGALIRGVSILKTKYDTQQAITYRPEWLVNRWYDEACTWIMQAIISWKHRRWRHNFDHACAEFGGCQFRQACSSENPQPWLEAAFERRIWNPLLREEKKL